MNSSEEIDFQNYIDSVKQKKTPWDIFENLMKDLSYSNIYSKAEGGILTENLIILNTKLPENLHFVTFET